MGRDPGYTAPCVAGWSSQVARRAHNPEVAGSNPAPAIEGARKHAGASSFVAPVHKLPPGHKRVTFPRTSESHRAKPHPGGRWSGPNQPFSQLRTFRRETFAERDATPRSRRATGVDNHLP